MPETILENLRHTSIRTQEEGETHILMLALPVEGSGKDMDCIPEDSVRSCITIPLIEGTIASPAQVSTSRQTVSFWFLLA